MVPLLLLTAFSRWVRASSMFLVCWYSTEPSWRWVRASILWVGLNWNTAFKQWTHRRILGGLDVRKCSAKPSRARYHDSGASVAVAILTVRQTTTTTNLVGGGKMVQFFFFFSRSSVSRAPSGPVFSGLKPMLTPPTNA